MLNVKNNKLCRAISVIAMLTMLFTTIAGVNVSAEVTSVANQSFYEDFEGYGDVTISPFTNDQEFAGGWKVRNAVGSAGNISEVAVSSADAAAKTTGKVVNLGVDVTNVAGPSLYKDPGITIGQEDIIISGDVYIPAANTADEKQYVRFYVSRGIETTDVAAANGWTAYNPAVGAAFGLFFYNRSDLDPANVWKVCIGAPRQDNAAFEYNSTATSAFTITPDTWYNLCYVYHPVTGEVDYYIDGKYLDSHPVGEAWSNPNSTGTKQGTYMIPTLAPGKPLGNINLMGGGYKSADTAAKFDNISVVTASAADEAKYIEVAQGTDYIFADWDIPVDKTTVSNVTVKKLAEEDVTFSGTGATDVAHTVTYRGTNGVGVQFTNKLTDAFGKYQIKVTGAKDVYGQTVNRVYNILVKDAPVVKGTPFGDEFTDDVTGWYTDATNNEVTISHDATNGLLTATRSGANKSIISPSMSIPVENDVEYIDLDFDLKAEANNANDAYEAYVKLGPEKGGLPIGILIDQTYIKPLSKAGARIDRPYTSNSDMLGNWKSYRLRYYPWKGEMAVYVGAAGSPLPETPAFVSKTYEGHNGGNPREGTNPFTWDVATMGNAISGFRIMLTQDSTTSLDNVKVTSYGFNGVNPVLGTVTEEFTTDLNGWYVNSTAHLAVSHVPSHEGKTGVLKATPAQAYGQALSPVTDTSYFNLPVNENVEYVDVSFDFRAEGTGTNSTSFETYIMLLESGTNNQRHTGFVLNEAKIRAAARNGKVLENDPYVLGNTLGEWKNYKLRYYPWEGKIQVFVDGASTPSFESDAFADRNETTKMGNTKLAWNSTTHGDRINGISFQVNNANTVVYVDNIKGASYGYPVKPTTLKGITFENGDGGMLDNKAGAKKVSVALDNATTTPVVKLGSTTLSGTFDAATGIYSANLPAMLIGNSDYTITVNDVPYTFATGAGAYKLSNLKFVNGSDVTIQSPLAAGTYYASVDAFNSTGTKEEPYLIWTGYIGGKMEIIGFDKLDVVAGFDEVVKGEAMTITNDYTAIKVFLWDGLDTMTPLLEECVVKKAEN